jgi:uncharacterized membrane protein
VTSGLEASGDLARTWVVVALLLAAASLVLLVVELVRAPKRGAAPLVAVTGVLALAALVAALLRPVSVTRSGSLVGPRLLVLADASKSIDLPADGGGTRREEVARALHAIRARASEVRASFLAFGDGEPAEIADPDAPAFTAAAVPRSDLVGALESVTRGEGERPSAIVVVSDGRLDRPAEPGVAAAVREALGGLAVPVHAVPLARVAPRDATIRAVRVAGAAVAHQPFDLRVEVGCHGGLACAEIPVVVRELRDQGDPEVLAEGTAKIEGETGVVALPLMLHRTGARVLEVSIDAPDGDALPDDDRRFVTIEVSRDRVRLLHIAGRATYDVRALRTWLKADASIDVVAFFILRSPTDDVGASQDELALIPFPVDELFSVHLPSFDAVILQDFNAEVYGLTRHLGALARYVKTGGGLVMVGGPDAFGPGRYAASPISEVLPVALGREHERPGVDLGWFTPRFTDAGRFAPMLGPLRDVVGDELPPMPGTNLVGHAREGATVLLEHPTLSAGDAPMPVLAVAEIGTGRSVALTIDGTHRLGFSTFAAGTAGRAHGALWDGIVGWLMRDPRYESAGVSLARPCLAGEEARLVVRSMPADGAEVSVEIARLGTGEVVHRAKVPLAPRGAPTEVPIGVLDAGGYRATVEIRHEGGRAPVVRQDFACEKGGDEWADPRPDVERLRAIAQATGGELVAIDELDELELPEATPIDAQRTVKPVAPPWAWTSAAAALLGAHWLVRRRRGLS